MGSSCAIAWWIRRGSCTGSVRFSLPSAWLRWSAVAKREILILAETWTCAHRLSVIYFERLARLIFRSRRPERSSGEICYERLHRRVSSTFSYRRARNCVWKASSRRTDLALHLLFLAPLHNLATQSRLYPSVDILVKVHEYLGLLRQRETTTHRYRCALSNPRYPLSPSQLPFPHFATALRITQRYSLAYESKAPTTALYYKAIYFEYFPFQIR